jgi:hypothetical protein
MYFGGPLGAPGAMRTLLGRSLWGAFGRRLGWFRGSLGRRGLLGTLLGASWVPSAVVSGVLRSALGRVNDKRMKRTKHYKTAGNHHVAQVPPILGSLLGAVWVCSWERAWELLGSLLAVVWGCSGGLVGAVIEKTEVQSQIEFK